LSYLAKMLDMLTGAYNKNDEHSVRNNLPMRTNIGRLFAVADWGLSLIQDNAEHVRLWADIDKAEGNTLDRYGANFGVARGGANDVFYRLLIRVKLLAQISGGDIDTIIAAVAGLYEIPPTDVNLHEVFPAKVLIDMTEENVPEGYEEIKDLVGILIKRLLAAGVGLDMTYTSYGDTDTEIFIGGRPVGEYTRIRTDGSSDAMPDLDGTIYIGLHIVSEFTRITLADGI